MLVEPVLRLMSPGAGQVVLDGTVGQGGHAAVIAPRLAPGGRYIGLDLDAAMLEAARARLATLGESVCLFQANFVDFREVLGSLGYERVDHVLLDLGVNSAQLADAQRGFSFERDGPLDMRYDRTRGRPALDLVNALSESELSDLFYKYGQEELSRKIARRICQVRHHGRITTTGVLARAVESAVAASGRAPRGRVHPATRVFQALRIAVNEELDNLRRFLELAAGAIRPGGTLCVISFHSLEDALVKRFLRDGRGRGVLEELTRRPIVADEHERRENPRSRSAKLRAARIVA